MNIYCLEDFKDEFEKLKTKKSYNSIEQDVINYFFNKNAQQLCSGVRLNNSSETPYIKKRINGSGGFRFYYLLIIKEEDLYLMFVHPKTGNMGAENITDESKAFLYKKVLECITNKKLYKLLLDSTTNSITFEKL